MNSTKYYFPKPTKKNFRRFCKILSSASYVPEKVVTNQEIIDEFHLPYKSETIFKAIGVESRHVEMDDLCDSDVLSMSAKKCLENCNLLPDHLSRLIVNKYFGDNLLPMTASRLLSKLGSGTAAHSFDIDGGINSFLHSVDVISRFINTGDNFVLLSSGGINRRLVSKTDPRVAFLFGDGSASLLFEPSEEQHILASYFYTNHNYYDLATALSPMAITNAEKDIDIMERLLTNYDTYEMGNWKIAEDFYRQAAREVSKNLLEESGLNMDNIDMVLITENNIKIWELTLEALGLSEDKSISLLKNYGNTMSAMLPLLLDYGFKTGRIQHGMNIMLISHGEGLSGGGLIYKV